MKAILQKLILMFKYIICAFFILGVTPLYSILWFLIRVFALFMDEKFYITWSNFLYGSYQKYLVFFFEVVSGVKIVLYGDHEDIFSRKENVVYFSNHQCIVDWVVMAMLAERSSSSTRTRFILKDSLKYIPMYGFHFKKHGYIYVKRSGHFDSDNYISQLDLLNQKNNPFWLVLYPEGHRLNPGKPHIANKVNQYAREHGLPVYEHLLTPRLKAFSLCVKTLKDKIDAIYDITIAFSSTLPSSPSLGDGSVPNRLQSPSYLDLYRGDMTIHIYLKRISFNEVPLESSAFEQWVYGRFEAKDELLSKFYSNDENLRGKLGDNGKVSKVNLINIMPYVLAYSSLLILCFTNHFILSLYLWSFLITFSVTFLISSIFF